ncbi:MAG TPA: putative LPS assembly protein LptD, partial [Flavobacteriaceae bacterium]|nr:putative LPS assembly protein LptD [Flavobacteriaceae bacterium]
SSRFSASVNLGSSRYYRRSINQSNAGNFLNNSLSSSISYSKTFSGEPQVNYSLTATHSQNTNTGEINMTLPTLQASVSRIYPFKPKIGVKKGIIENINFQYSLRAENRFNTTDSLFFKPEMFENAVFGAQHSIPVNTNFKLFNYLSVSAGTGYNETWVFKTYEQSYDEQRQEVVIDTINGFESYRTYNFNSSIGTTIYGMFNFGKDKKIQAIRHVMRPSISYNINPGFDQFYDEYTIPGIAGTEDEIVPYSKFEGTLYGAPGRRYSSSIGFSLSNNFEAKVRNIDSTGVAAEPRKITLLSNLNFSTAYDLARDSLNLSPINVSGSIPIIQNKLDINFRGQLDMYALNNNNQRIDKLNINNGGSLFRLTRGNISFGYSLSNSLFDGSDKNTDKLENETLRNGGRADDLFGKSTNLNGTFYDEEEEDEEPIVNDTERYHYAIPWDLRLAYTMTYNNMGRENEISSHSIMFSGDVELSPRWSVGVSSGYDIKNQGFTYTQFRFQRDLESWTMSFNWTPFGIRESWYFYIGIKASVLSDIKYDKNRPPDGQL